MNIINIKPIKNKSSLVSGRAVDGVNPTITAIKIAIRLFLLSFIIQLRVFLNL